MFFNGIKFKIFCCAEPADMRKSFNGLTQMTRDFIKEDLLKAHLFLFKNKRGDKLKILYWDEDGYAIWYKQLEMGTFKFPVSSVGKVSITEEELIFLLKGLEVSKIKQRKRFKLEKS